MNYNYSSFLENEINTQIPKEILYYNYNLKNNIFQNENNSNDNNNDNNNYIYKNFVI